MYQQEQAIGVFDSGIGGLTVLDAIRQTLPNENLIYLGDTARVPYGNKSPDTVQRYALGCASFLAKQQIKALVIACNTASAFGLDAVRAALEIPVIGVIEPVAQRAAHLSQSAHIGVLGTRGTISSQAYPSALKTITPKLEVQQQPCPLFVPLVEEGWIDDPVTLDVAKRYLSAFEQSAIDTLILGCTHYPVISSIIDAAAQQVLGRSVHLCDSATATAEALRILLENQSLRSKSVRQGSTKFFVTDIPSRFAAVGELFVHFPITQVAHIDL